ncbi:restriction endonuclease subunit S [Psychromarinibacter halotolerans]|uniref:restriction endonuclease subunit S n=1 Tax=Psychromarinibacter halotolerans TaxID=1775175 RepID=UPI0023D89377|nr:restriction endonuclease subunit S [Psychromarinibacter halotolerans]
MIRSQCVHDRQFDLDALSFISPEQAKGLRGVEVRSGDLLLNITGDGVTFGRCCLAPDAALPAVVNQHVAIIRPDRARLSPGFLLSFLTHPEAKPYIESFNAGGSRRAITKGHIENFEIPLPPIAEQEAIAALLQALDDKIELNRRMSATLEEMARALYRSWFVDFDPVHARALGQSPAHMDPTAAALFPDSFGPDGLPKGWERRSLDDIVDFLNGAALQKFPPEDGAESLPVIKIAELRSGITSKSGRAGLQVPEKYKISDGDVLFSWSGSLLQKVWTEGPGALNQHLFKVSSEVVPKWFHFFAVDQHMEEFRQVAASKATTMGHIQRHHLKEAMIAMPEDDAVVAAAGELIGPAFERAISADLESQTLATLRDSLLPRLMSGELRIREAEKRVEEVV